MKRLKLTVCYINSYMMQHTGQGPSFRTASIVLTEDQCRQLSPRLVVTCGRNGDIYEEFDRVVLEEETSHAD